MFTRWCGDHSYEAASEALERDWDRMVTFYDFDVVYTPIDVTSPEYLPGYCHLSKLKHQPPGMPHQMSTHLDELGLHASQ